MRSALQRLTVAVAMGLTSIFGGVAVVAVTAASASAEGICPRGHDESGAVGGLMACVHRKTGKTILVEM